MLNQDIVYSQVDKALICLSKNRVNSNLNFYHDNQTIVADIVVIDKNSRLSKTTSFSK